VTVSRARTKGAGTPRSRREIARGIIVEIPERGQGGWQIRRYGPLDWPIRIVAKHRGEGRGKRTGRPGRHREQS
jgi:hypothetical protein